MRYFKDAPGDWGKIRGSDTVEVGTDHFVMPDRCRLFYRFWRTGSADVLVILHGLGGHGGWYIELANRLSEQGLNVYVMDHRGFGRSEGHPGHIERHQTYIEDIYTIIKEIKQHHPGARLHVLGHSMGGIFTAYLAAKHGSALSSVLFLNPWVRDTSKLSALKTASIVLKGLLKSRQYQHVEGGHEAMTTNPEAIEMLLADPYWRRQQTATFLLQITLMRSAILSKAKQITVPALVFQADLDKAVVPAATREFYDALASQDKQWITYPSYSHDSQFESEPEQLVNDILAWIRKHAPEQA